MNKSTTGCREVIKLKTRCFVSKKGKWCWSNNTRKNKCRLVKGKKETCCINPKRGHWCWSNNTKKNVVKKLKRSCCNRR
uniref:Uncharacterized protein n=1 Tax=viral metagenome TaxID=1070528 RepID=A0A6C0HHM9_9ZZZZ